MNGHVNGTAERQIKKGLVDVIASNTKCIWNKKVENTEIDRLRGVINEKYSTKLKNYWDLHEWSVKHYALFWEEIWHFYDVIHSKPYHVIAKNGKGFTDTDWFSGARLNFAENMLRFRNDEVAMICVDEDENDEIITHAKLYEEVERYAAAFRKNGLQPGDRVACYLSNRKEAVYGYLAATSVGAIWGGAVPFYGGKGASKIIRPMLPKFLFVVDRIMDSKTEKHLMKNIPQIVNDLDCLKKIVICPSKEETLSYDIKQLDPRCCFLEDFLETGKNADGSTPTLVFEQLPFNHPISINCTSGTTGQPKGLVHACGAFLPLLRDFNLHCNLKKGDVVYSSNPVGWNAWNLFIANFVLGVKLVLHDACPFYPEEGFWELMDKYKVTYTFLVTSLVDKMERSNIVPGPGCKLEHLKMLTVGASPVKLQNVEFLLSKVKKDIFLNCLYGATEVLGVFSGFDLNTPVYSSEIQAPALGVDIQCFDPQGNSVLGQKGELVVCTPNPAFPIAIWNDSNGKKLKELYLSKYPGIWCQNDECWIDPKTKGIVIIGRSDDVLNPNGEIFGSSDIYYAIHTMDELQDYICVGQNNNEGEQRAVLFVKVKPAYTFSQELVKKIKKQIETEYTHDYVPEVILEVQDIPFNLTGKKLEKLVKTIVATNEIPEAASIKNPECLNQYCNIPELQDY